MNQIAPIIIALLLSVQNAFAVPGPATTAVVANANDPTSMILAQRYADVRHVPDSNVCSLDLPDDVDISLSDFETRWMMPLFACLGERIEQIEAVLLVRGVPLRVHIPVDGGVDRVSAAAAVSVWQTRMGNGRPMRGVPPGQQRQCGNTPCLAPRFENPYRSGHFEPGWQRFAAGIDWRPVLVTMLHGRNFEDAGRLLDSALNGEQTGGGEGTFLLMQGGDPARSALDPELEPAAEALTAIGFEAEVVPFDSDLTGRDLAAFVTGSAQLGEVIEGNTYRPGALVDNLTSYGALPVNFTADGQQQVSIARWVAQGVAGAHGTTDEPLSHVFPSRQFLVDYAHGMTLAESYHRNLPFAYWRNLVLGDPMAAPYAARPRVSLAGLVENEVLEAGLQLTALAMPSGEDEVVSVSVYVDGLLVQSVQGNTLEVCLRIPARPVQILVVARTGGTYPAKGWAAHRITGAGDEMDCAFPPDAGPSPSPDPFDMGSVSRPDAALDGSSPMLPDRDAVVDMGPDLSIEAAGEVDGGCRAGDGSPHAMILFWCILLCFRRR